MGLRDLGFIGVHEVTVTDNGLAADNEPVRAVWACKNDTCDEVIGAWRYMDYKFKSGAPIEKLTLNGPAIGVAFRW